MQTSKTFAQFLADWNAAGRPQYIDHAHFLALGYETHCCNHLYLSREGIAPAILEAIPADRRVTVSPLWTATGVVVQLGYPGIYACGQAVFCAAELGADGSVLQVYNYR